MKKLTWPLFAAALVAGCTGPPTAIAPTAPMGPETGARQETLASTSDLMATPFGWYHRDCVHVVPNGAHIDKQGLVRRLDGSTYRIPSCSHPGRVTGNSPEINRWVEWTHYAPGTAWGKIVASWHVPAAPTASYGVLDDTNQTLFTFPGLENTALTGIVQPVLTYGNQGTYGGNYWTATSWICSYECEHSDTVLDVSVGDSMVGTVTASSCSGGDCNWTILTTDVTTGHTSTLGPIEDVSSYTYAVGGSMEVYAIQSCPHFPVNGVFLKGIKLYDQSNTQQTPSWADTVQSGLSPWCGFSVTSTSSTTSLNDDPGPSVYLSGPTTGTPNQLVTITSHPSLGITPYYYSWAIVNGTGSCGNTSTCSGHLSSTGGSTTTFELTLFDADSVETFAEQQVNVCANVPVISVSAGPQPNSPQKC